MTAGFWKGAAIALLVTLLPTPGFWSGLVIGVLLTVVAVYVWRPSVQKATPSKRGGANLDGPSSDKGPLVDDGQASFTAVDDALSDTTDGARAPAVATGTGSGSGGA